MADVSVGGGGGQTPSSEPSLERVMGPWLLLLFIVGDILGTGIYALTGNVAKQVGGVVWLPFLVAFVVALLTAFSYLELVTKYPRAAGAALYTHRAFGIHFVTFIVAFAVMCSGITSASTASRAFAANFGHAFNLDITKGIGLTIVGLGFMALVAVVNFRGVGDARRPGRRRDRRAADRDELRRLEPALRDVEPGRHGRIDISVTAATAMSIRSSGPRSSRRPQPAASRRRPR